MKKHKIRFSIVLEVESEDSYNVVISNEIFELLQKCEKEYGAVIGMTTEADAR